MWEVFILARVSATATTFRPHATESSVAHSVLAQQRQMQHIPSSRDSVEGSRTTASNAAHSVLARRRQRQQSDSVGICTGTDPWDATLASRAPVAHQSVPVPSALYTSAIRSSHLGSSVMTRVSVLARPCRRRAKSSFADHTSTRLCSLTAARQAILPLGLQILCSKVACQLLSRLQQPKPG
jgi:hypothetical protein